MRDLKNKENSIIQAAKEKASNILLEAKEDVDNVIREIENASSSKEANQKRKEFNQKLEEIASSSTPLPIKSVKKGDLKIGCEVSIPRISQERNRYFYFKW